MEKRLVAAVEQAGGLAWRFTSPGRRGVPDRICLFPNGRLAFVEVKARPAFAAAAEAISHRQKQRIARAAAHYLAANPRFAGLTHRFDVVLVAPRRWPRHIIDAWRESGD